MNVKCCDSFIILTLSIENKDIDLKNTKCYLNVWVLIKMITYQFTNTIILYSSITLNSYDNI